MGTPESMAPREISIRPANTPGTLRSSDSTLSVDPINQNFSLQPCNVIGSDHPGGECEEVEDMTQPRTLDGLEVNAPTITDVFAL